MDAVLSAEELVIDEEERALLDSLALETDAPKNTRKNVAQKMQRKRSLKKSGGLPFSLSSLQGTSETKD